MDELRGVRTYWRFAFVVAALLASACGDKVTVPPAIVSPTVPPQVRAVIVVPGAVTLDSGDRITMVASVNADAGITDRTVTWTSSNPSIAAVDVNGVVTALGPGNTTVTATSKADPNVRGAALITVNANRTPLTFGFNTTIAEASDPASHEPSTRYTTVRLVSAAVIGSTVTVTGPAPWVTVTGTLNADGTFTTSGVGTVAGFPNVTVTFTGSVNATTGTISGTIVLGPGLAQNQNETLTLTGTRQ